jgi:hypothetical protein
MYLQLLNFTAFFFCFLFVAYLIYALDWKGVKQFWITAKIKAINFKQKTAFIKKQTVLYWKVVKQFWINAKIKAINLKQKKAFIKKQTALGLKPYEFDKGNTIIYAKNGNIALMDYKKMIDAQNRVIRKLKKA